MIEQRGQVTIEYFLLFAVIIIITLLGLTSFDEDIQSKMKQGFQNAIAPITN